MRIAWDVVESSDEEEQLKAQEELAGSEHKELPAPSSLPTSLSPEENEALAQHNAARHDWIEQVGTQDRRMKSRNYQRIADYQVSTTDPDATIMRSKGGVLMSFAEGFSTG